MKNNKLALGLCRNFEIVLLYSGGFDHVQAFALDVNCEDLVWLGSAG